MLTEAKQLVREHGDLGEVLLIADSLASEEHKELIRFLVMRYRADILRALSPKHDNQIVNLRNDGDSLLHLVVGINPPDDKLQDAIETCAALLEVGIPVDVRNDDEVTPLHFACLGSQPGIVEFLIERGASINAVTDLGDTPLICAAKAKNAEIANILLSNGADVNAQSDFGMRPVMFAIGSPELMDLLLDSGADTHCHCSEGTTLLSYILESGTETVAQSVLEHQQDSNTIDQEKLNDLIADSQNLNKPEFKKIFESFRQQ